MDIILYIIIFLIGIFFGSFYTLAVYRIPRREDITHTHSYCPNCKHKLGILDLIPVFSYIFLGGKCRYCKKKIRPRYFILEILSGIFFVLVAYLLGLSYQNMSVEAILNFVFFVLYFTFIVLFAGIDSEYRKINKQVLMYGIIISLMYIVYLCIIDLTSIYRYGIYLVLYIILLLTDTIYLKKKALDSYPLDILLAIIIMIIFTSEYIVINSCIATLLSIAIYLIIRKVQIAKGKSKKTETEINKEISVGLYMSITNILFYIIILGICNFGVK